jgi:hypothetical protein
MGLNYGGLGCIWRIVGDAYVVMLLLQLPGNEEQWYMGNRGRMQAERLCRPLHCQNYLGTLNDKIEMDERAARFVN